MASLVGQLCFPAASIQSRNCARVLCTALAPVVFKESCTVTVRGFKVEITAKLINNYFHTLDDSNDPGLSRMQQEVFAYIDPGFVSVLWWDKRNTSQDLLYKELHPEMAFWMTFVNRNLMIPLKPLSKTVISSEMAQPLFSIKRVGGVSVRGNQCSPVADIRCDWYNVFAQNQGLPTLVSRRRGREPVPVQLQPGNADRPNWVNEVTGRLNSLLEMMVGQFNALSTQINNVGVRVTSLEDAMRDAGFKQLNPSRRVRIRHTE